MKILNSTIIQNSSKYWLGIQEVMREEVITKENVPNQTSILVIAMI